MNRFPPSPFLDNFRMAHQPPAGKPGLRPKCKWTCLRRTGLGTGPSPHIGFCRKAFRTLLRACTQSIKANLTNGSLVKQVQITSLIARLKSS